MPILGAHMSIAGGYYKSIDSGAEAGCQCVQLFTKNNNQWRAKDITDEDVDRFQTQLSTHGIKHTLSHASYLINMASPKDELWSKSVDAFVIELQRAELLGVPYVVVHPGSYTTSTAAEGIQKIAVALDEVADPQDAERLERLRDDARDGRLARARVAREDHVQRGVGGHPAPHASGRTTIKHEGMNT